MTRTGRAPDTWFALVATTIGGSTLVGNLVGGSVGGARLTRWVIGLPAVTPVTGAIIGLYGVALLLRRSPLVAAGPALLAAVLTALAIVARITHQPGPLSSWATGPPVRDQGLPGVPAGSTLVSLAATSVAIGLLLLGVVRAAQGVAVIPAMVGGLALLSIVYGDRVTADPQDRFPGTITAAPAAVALIFLAIAVMAAEPAVGFVGWISADSPGRRVVRRLVPIVVLTPLVLAGLARWFNLGRHVGEARAWAVVMTVVTAGLCALAVGAVGLIDRYAAAARRGEVNELRLTSALRLARVADLARELVGAVTIEEVSDVVNSSAAAVLAARAASVGLIDRNAGVLRVHHGPGVSTAIRERYANPDLDAALAFTDAARTGEPVFVADYEEYRDRYPSSDPANSQLGTGARASLPLVDRTGTTFGAMALSWDHPIDFDESVTATLSTIADLVAQSLERARLTEELARQARRNAELAHLAEALATSATAADVMSFLAEHITGPLDAAAGVVGVIDRDEGVLRRHFSAQASESVARLFATEALDRDLPLVDAARDGTTVILRNRNEVELRYPHTLGRFDAAGFVATAHVPLRDRTGTSFGAIGIGWHQRVEFDEGLLAMLSTVGDLAAQTLERAWLGDEREVEGDRARRLASLAESLAVAKTARDVAAVVARDLVGMLRAGAANLALVVDGSDELEVHHDPDALEWFSQLELADDLPHPEAINSASTIVLPNLKASTERFPRYADAMSRAGLESALIVPVMTGDDRPLAAIGVAWTHRITLDGGLQSTIATVSELVGQTLERVELAEAEHRLVVGLQRRIVVPLPPVPGLEVAARYEPAAQQLGMGGDWYEGVVRAEGTQLGLIVGDVAGHGTDAAVEMLQLSRVLSTLLHVGVGLDEFFSLARGSASTSSIFATALVCVIDPVGQTLSYVAAGHPPPILIPTNGSARALSSGRHPMIGLPAAVVPSSAAQFGIGATLVAYTDGLIERRDEGIDAGIERLRLACEEGRELSPDALIDHVVEACTADRVVEDDLAVVIVRSVQAPAATRM